MAFKKELCKNYYLCDTPIENIFIDEYMIDAPGEYVKVYIYAQMYSGLNQVMTNELISKRLDMNIEDVLAAWTYWESLGIIRKHYPNLDDELHFDVEFINIKNKIYSNSSTTEKKKNTDISSILNDQDLSDMYGEIQSIVGQPIDTTSAVNMGELIDSEGISPSLIAYAYRFCKENNKSTNFKYVASIVRNWNDNKVKTVEDAKSFIEKTDGRFAEYRQIMKALGLSFASITDQEKRVFNTWLDEMDYNLAFILEACNKAAGMSNKFSYVKKVLENEYEKKNGGQPGVPKKRSLNTRQRYYEKIRKENQDATKQRRDEVYAKIPEIYELEEELRTLGMEMGRYMVSDGDNKKEAIEMTRTKINKLQNNKTNLLNNNGFSNDYMDDIYTCSRCKDTGILDDGGHCSCYEVSTS